MLSEKPNQGGIEIRQEPLLPPAALDEFKARLADADCYLEYGAGGSTRLAVRMAVPVIYSVESDAAFAGAVTDAVEETQASLDRRVAFVLTVPDIGETGALGFPTTNDGFKAWPEYPLGIWDRIAADGYTPDLILVDGRFRVASFLASLLNGRAGATILFDDYTNRTRNYGVVERFVTPVRFAARMAVFEVPIDPPLRAIAACLARYCLDPI